VSSVKGFEVLKPFELIVQEIVKVEKHDSNVYGLKESFVHKMKRKWKIFCLVTLSVLWCGTSLFFLIINGTNNHFFEYCLIVSYLIVISNSTLSTIGTSVLFLTIGLVFCGSFCQMWYLEGSIHRPGLYHQSLFHPKDYLSFC
jgi:hypothetical protein